MDKKISSTYLLELTTFLFFICVGSQTYANEVNANVTAVKIVCLASKADNLVLPAFYSNLGTKEEREKVGPYIDAIQAIIKAQENTETAGLAELLIELRPEEDKREVRQAISSYKKLISTFPPIDTWRYIPLGSGFIVDHEGKYVVTNWHVQEACPMTKGKFKIGIIDNNNGSLIPILGQLKTLPADTETEKKYQKALENIQVDEYDKLTIEQLKGDHLPKVICKKDEESGKDKECENIAPGGLRKRVKEDVAYYAPDLAVIELAKPSSVRSVELVDTPDLKSGTQVVFSGFPISTEDTSTWQSGDFRVQEVTPTTTGAVISKPITLSSDVFSSDINASITAKFYELSGNLVPGNSGGPVIKDGKIVGMATMSKVGNHVGYAIPSNEVIAYLEKLNIRRYKGSTKSIDKNPPSPSLGEKVKQVPPLEHASIFSSQYIWYVGIAIFALLAGLFVWIFGNKEDEETSESSINGNSHKADEPANDTTVDTRSNYQSLNDTVSFESSVELQGLSGEHRGRTLNIFNVQSRKAVTIGRDASTCQVVFTSNNIRVSKVHCRISWDDKNGKAMIEDMKSTNGTYLNRMKLQENKPYTLNNGDVITLGSADGEETFSVIYK